jgi:hypothetical protein
MQIRQADKHMQTSLRGIAKRAKENPKHRFGNLYGLLNEANLRRCFAQLIVFKWLNRRSQHKSCNWRGFQEMLEHFRIPRPRIISYWN